MPACRIGSRADRADSASFSARRGRPRPAGGRAAFALEVQYDEPDSAGLIETRDRVPGPGPGPTCRVGGRAAAGAGPGGPGLRGPGGLGTGLRGTPGLGASESESDILSLSLPLAVCRPPAGQPPPAAAPGLAACPDRAVQSRSCSTGTDRGGLSANQVAPMLIIKLSNICNTVH